MALAHPLAALSGGDVVCDAVTTPEASLLVRQILQVALAAQGSQQAPWCAEAWALLGNVLANDYLNGWNNAGRSELQDALNAVRQSKAVEKNKNSGLGRHAHGLIHRARGRPDDALQAFNDAVVREDGFARAHAQLGNQLSLAGQTKQARAEVQTALKAHPCNPAAGYFHWIIGRSYFFDTRYASAINSLNRSVKMLPTVWYNRLYLVAAYELLGQVTEAKAGLQDFYQQIGRWTLKDVQNKEKNNPSTNPIVVAARKKLYDGLGQVMR